MRHLGRQKIPFIGSGYVSKSVNLNAQRCVNLYLETGGPEGKSPAALFRTPGLTDFCELPYVNRGKGLYVTSTGRWFAIAGNKLYEIFNTASFVSRGTLDTFTGPVWMSDNGATASIGGDQLFITDGVSGYIFTFSTNIFAKITDVNFPGGGPSTFQDNFFLVAKPGSREVFASNLLDGTTWNALSFGVKEGIGDPIVGLQSNGQDLLVIGSLGLEIWYNSGAYPFPFERRLGTLNRIGLAARASIVLLKDMMFWVGEGDNGHGQVFMLKGFSPVNISDNAVSNYLASLPSINDAVGWGYERDGHYFYLISLQEANRTLCYDMTTGAWHDRAYLDPISGEFSKHRGIACIFFQGENYVSDYASGKIYKLDPNAGTDAGNPLKWLRSSPHFSANEDRLICDEFQVVMQSGMGNSNPPGNDPKAFLRISRDGAHTWSFSREGNMGRIGEYQTRCRWLRNGLARDFVFEVSGTEPVPTVLIDGVGRYHRCSS